MEKTKKPWSLIIIFILLSTVIILLPNIDYILINLTREKEPEEVEELPNEDIIEETVKSLMECHNEETNTKLSILALDNLVKEVQEEKTYAKDENNTYLEEYNLCSIKAPLFKSLGIEFTCEEDQTNYYITRHYTLVNIEGRNLVDETTQYNEEVNYIYNEQLNDLVTNIEKQLYTCTLNEDN